jgi:hypothetical protein
VLAVETGTRAFSSSIPRKVMKMIPLPTSFPADAVAVLLPLLRGQLPSDKTAAVTAAWNVVGFGCSQIVPAPASSAAMAPLTPAEVAVHLETALASHKSGDMLASLPTLPWQSIITALTQILMQWLAGA